MRIGPGVLLGAQVLLSVYAGYFGGGVGIMMMAVWSLLGEVDIKAMSAGRTLLVSAANAVAVLCFALAGPVRWPETLVMLVAAVIGGYFGAALARRIPAPVAARLRRRLQRGDDGGLLLAGLVMTGDATDGISRPAGSPAPRAPSAAR